MSKFYCWTCRRWMAAGWAERHMASLNHLEQVLRQDVDPIPPSRRTR